MIYTHKCPDVAAVRWLGDNLDEVSTFLERYTGMEPEYLGVRDTKDSFVLRGQTRTYHVLQFYAWGDDQEVDLGRWIVIELDDDIEQDGLEDFSDGKIYTNAEFVRKFIKKADDVR